MYNNCNCGCRNNCITLAVISSVIIGVITTVLRITAVITVTPAFLWVLLGIAVVYLLASLIAAPHIRFNGRNDCVCTILPIYLLGILGTILTSVILLGITFVATSIPGAIITGLLLLFFSLIITSASCLIKCIVNCDGIE